MPRMVIRICDNQHSSTHIGMSKLSCKRNEKLVCIIEQNRWWALFWYGLCYDSLCLLFLFCTTLEWLWWFKFPLDCFCTLPSSELVPPICCLTRMANTILVTTSRPKKYAILSVCCLTRMACNSLPPSQKECNFFSRMRRRAAHQYIKKEKGECDSVYAFGQAFLLGQW